jgi:hypothetical protein
MGLPSAIASAQRRTGGQIEARVIEQLIARGPSPICKIIISCRRFTESVRRPQLKA